MVGFAEQLPHKKAFCLNTLRRKMLSFTFNNSRTKGQWRSKQDNVITKSTYHVDSTCLEEPVNASPSSKTTFTQAIRITQVVTTDKNDPRESWVELQNMTDEPVDMSGWRLVDSRERTRVITQLKLKPKESVKLRNVSPLRLNKSLRLYTKNSQVMDDVTFKSKEGHSQLSLVHMNL